MIDINFASKEEQLYDGQVSHNSILILGKGETEYKSLKITYPSSISDVENNYGKYSELTEAYTEAVKAGATNIFLCNCYRFTDYVDALDLIAQNDFAFVCPLFKFSTTFINPDTHKEMYLAELYSAAAENSFSNIIISDLHASLYEDLSQYLKAMKLINYRFKETTYGRLVNGQALAFTLNMLNDYKYSNIALSALIAESSLRNYPQKDLGEVVFDITNNDVFDHEFIYFAYNNLTKTTIENLQNYHEETVPEKMLLISIIKNRINMSLDYEDYTGKLINSYTKISLDNYTRKVMSSHIGTLISNYNILKIDYIKVDEGQINIDIYMSIKPYNSIEEINMKVEA